MKMTQAQYLAYLARRNNPTGSTAMSGEGNLPNLNESDLHDQIMAECRRRGWPCFHCRMDMPTTANIGQPDFIIMAEFGRTLYVEAKSSKGKLTTAQRAIGAWATTLAHTVHVVRSFEEFLKIL